MIQIEQIHPSEGPYQLDGYTYRVEMLPSKYNELKFWIDETGFKCSTWNDIISTVIYIKNEPDLAFFLLRWL